MPRIFQSFWFIFALSLALTGVETEIAVAHEASHIIDFPVSYRSHLESHILRVKALSLEIQRSFPQSFRHVDRKLLVDFIDLHDGAKREPHFYRQLVLNFGQRLPPQSEFVKQLNQRDFDLRRRFFVEVGLLIDGKESVAAEELLRIENIADLVDRGLDPVAAIEFGRLMKPASAFLHVYEDQIIAQAIEARYSIVTQGFDYFTWHSIHGVSRCRDMLEIKYEGKSD